MHPRNRYQGHYDLPFLIDACPELATFVAPTAHGPLSIDLSNPEAVKTLNRALLIHYYGIKNWDLPPGYLCPGVPGRADYVHTLAELIPEGSAVRGLDIGVGASCIYPIIGHGEYGWHFVGSDIDRVAIASAEKIVKANPSLHAAVELRIQPSPALFFRNVIRPGEKFQFTICNPPFHASMEEASAGSQRKWENLGRSPGQQKNFGGQSGELWTPGGEVAFLRRMIKESREFSENVEWFTTMLSKIAHLTQVQDALNQVQATDRKVIPMSQGQKQSRMVAWTFRTP
jgi:23S rRNA (adenine1618-N6)-methyltransferase